MADYTNRPNELAKKYDDLKKNVTAAGPTAGPTITTATWGILEASMSSYLDWREKILAEGLNYIKAGSDTTGKDQQDKWKSFMQKQCEEAKKRVDAFLSRPEHKMLQEFIELTSLQEALFFTALTDMPMAQFQGEMREYIKDFKKKKEECVGEWNRISQLDQQRDAEWATLRVKIMEESKRTMEDLLGLNKKLADFAIKSLPTVVAKGVTLPVSGPAGLVMNFIADQGIKYVVKSLLEKINATRPTTDNYVTEAQRLTGNRNTIITVFNNKRDEVQRILTIYNPDVMLKRYDELANRTREQAGKAGVPGAVEDAKKYAEKLISESRPAYEDFKTCHGEFTSVLNGIFVGTISSNTKEQLAEASFFYNFMKDYAAIDLYEGYKQTAADVAKIFDLSLDVWDDKNREQIKELLRIEFAPLFEEVKKIDKGAFSRVKDFIGECGKQVAEKLNR